jgi:membrane associated rhomboid family serine protease/Flp pilus assembly protein TadD
LTFPAPLPIFHCLESTPTPAPTPREARRQEAAAFAAELNQIAPSRPVVTYALIAICTAVYVFELIRGAGFWSMSPDLAISLGANYGPLTLSGQWWRLFTSMFLHFGFFHVFMNMWCLLFLGSLAERLMGRAEFLLLYIATGLFGSLLSLAVHPQLVAAGASGAVFGVTGGLITYLGLKKAPLDFARAKKQLTNLAVFVGINFFYSLGPGIDMMAHLGGLISGLIIAIALPRFLETFGTQLNPAILPEKSSINKKLVAIGIACAIAIVAACVGIRHTQGDSAFVVESLDQIDAGHSAAVIPRLEQIVKAQPDNSMAHFALGNAYLSTNQYGGAVQELFKADTLAPGNALTEQNLGVAYMAQGSYDVAITKLRQSLATNPDNPRARLGLANSLLGAKQYQDAADEARKVVAALPKDAEAHEVLGHAEVNLGQTDDGIHEMETALQLDPNNVEMRTDLLAVYMATGHTAQYRALQSQSPAPATTPPSKTPTGH